MRNVALVGLVVVFVAGDARAGFLDLASVTPGGQGAGAFAGSLDGIAVTGSVTSVTGDAGFFIFQPVGAGFENSTIDNSSPQYSYGNIYTPSQALGDRVGYTMFDGQNGTARFQITFAQPVTNPVFHIAKERGRNNFPILLDRGCREAPVVESLPRNLPCTQDGFHDTLSCPHRSGHEDLLPFPAREGPATLRCRRSQQTRPRRHRVHCRTA